MIKTGPTQTIIPSLTSRFCIPHLLAERVGMKAMTLPMPRACLPQA